MLRNDTILCGTSTTGTGTLSLAACPVPPGGLDPYAWLTATGFGFTNGNALLVSYQIIEYTDSTFATAKQYEKGIGTLTLSASLAASTLARTLVQQAVSSLNTTGSPSYASPSGINIGTAVNTLVFCGPSAADLFGCTPFFDNATSGNDNKGIQPANLSGTSIGGVLASLTDYYFAFEWRVPMVVKKCTMRVFTGTGGGTSAAYARIYQLNSSGRPGKLLVDFGAFAGTNPLNSSNTTISTTALSNGVLLLPGMYVFDFLPQFSAGSPVMIAGTPTCTVGYLGSGNLNPNDNATATSGTAGAGPDPANTSGYAGQGGTVYVSTFQLASS